VCEGFYFRLYKRQTYIVHEQRGEDQFEKSQEAKTIENVQIYIASHF